MTELYCDDLLINVLFTDQVLKKKRHTFQELLNVSDSQRRKPQSFIHDSVLITLSLECHILLDCV